VNGPIDEAVEGLRRAQGQDGTCGGPCGGEQLVVTTITRGLAVAFQADDGVQVGVEDQLVGRRLAQGAGGDPGRARLAAHLLHGLRAVLQGVVQEPGADVGLIGAAGQKGRRPLQCHAHHWIAGLLQP